MSIYDEYCIKIFGRGLLKKGVKFIDYIKSVADIYNEKILEAKIHLKEAKK